MGDGSWGTGRGGDWETGVLGDWGTGTLFPILDSRHRSNGCANDMTFRTGNLLDLRAKIESK